MVPAVDGTVVDGTVVETVAETIDARGMRCPEPIIAAKRRIGAVPPGAVMEVLASDRATLVDLPVWCRRLGHEFLGSVAREGYWSLRIRRKPEEG